MTRLARITCLLVLMVAGRADAQQPVTGSADVLRERWWAHFEQVLAERRLRLGDRADAPTTDRAAAARVLGDPADVRAAYAETIRRVMLDPALATRFEPDLKMVEEVSSTTDQAWVGRLAAEVTREKGAKSANSPLTNPAAPKGAERSGFADLVSLALDAKNFVAADESAVTVNLSALALVGMSSPVRSAQAMYRQHGALRRLGGSFTFGSKIPEGEITGLTGLPSAENLLDAIGWDVKYRVYGDRDPRAKRWYGLMLGYMGGIVNISSDLLGIVPSGDRDIAKALLSDTVRVSLAAVKTRLERSAQVTFKAGGQHLSKEAGKNKYTFALLADKGWGDTDVTANASYAVVDDVTLMPGAVFTLKSWSGAAALHHLVAKNLIVEERAIELSLDARFEIPVDTGGLPIERKRTWRVIGGVSLPWGDAATIPVSITYASDPNSLTKEKFFTGHIGISYDFGALKKLFAPGASEK